MQNIISKAKCGLLVLFQWESGTVKIRYSRKVLWLDAFVSTVCGQLLWLWSKWLYHGAATGNVRVAVFGCWWKLSSELGIGMRVTCAEMSRQLLSINMRVSWESGWSRHSGVGWWSTYRPVGEWLSDGQRWVADSTACRAVCATEADMHTLDRWWALTEDLPAS